MTVLPANERQFVVGTGIVLLSTWMYTIQKEQVRPPIIRAGFESEKEKIVSPSDVNDSSISIPNTPLFIYYNKITTSRPVSPAPNNKSKHDSLGYFPRQ